MDKNSNQWSEHWGNVSVICYTLNIVKHMTEPASLIPVAHYTEAFLNTGYQVSKD